MGAFWRADAVAKREWDPSEAIAWIATGNESYLNDVSTANAYLRQYLPRRTLNRILLTMIRFQVGAEAFGRAATNLIEQLEAGNICSIRRNGPEGLNWADVVPARFHSEPPACRFLVRDVLRMRPRHQSQRGRRRGAGGYAQSDQTLLDDVLNALVESGMPPWIAAGVAAEQAEGAGTLQSKQHRLFRRYKDSLTALDAVDLK